MKKGDKKKTEKNKDNKVKQALILSKPSILLISREILSIFELDNLKLFSFFFLKNLFTVVFLY